MTETIPPRYMQIVRDVAREHSVPVSWIFQKDTKRDAAWPRQAAYARIRSTPMTTGKLPSYPAIGRWIGGRDHTTVIEGIRKYEARRSAAPTHPAEVRDHPASALPPT